MAAPVLVATLLGGLLTIVSSVVGRVLVALGIGFVTYAGFDFLIDWLIVEIKANFSALPSEIVGFLAFMWVDKAIGVLFSAYNATLVIKLAGGNAIKKMVLK